jgi:hypothetical protein
MIDTLFQQPIQCHMYIRRGILEKAVFDFEIWIARPEACCEQAEFFFGEFGATAVSTDDDTGIAGELIERRHVVLSGQRISD